MEISYITCDVFTSRRFGGNPLAVVPDAKGLSDAQMQSIAAEFNYSETTFVLPPRNPAHRARVRIFTPKAEMPFAGHPNIGTALMLAELGLVTGDSLVFEELAGLVPIRFETGAEGRQAVLTAPARPRFTDTVAPRDVARAADIKPSAILINRHAPILASAGAQFLLVELADMDVLEGLRRSQTYADLPGEGVYFYVLTGPGSLRARMFAPKHGIPEDPATGSAAAALAGLLGTFEGADGIYPWVLDQGIEMGRPSRIMCAAERVDGEVVKATVGGTAVSVARGTMKID